MLAEHDQRFHTHAHDRERDHEHVHPTPTSLREVPITLANLPRLAALLPIWLYQLTFSRLLPPNTCRFHPTCSRYGFGAIARYGLIKGGLMAAWRVLRCNPFTPGGYDPVPEVWTWQGKPPGANR